MKYIVYTHVTYLCLIPILGAFAALSLDPDSYLLRMAGWIPGVVTIGLIIDEYRILKNVYQALFLVALVPIQIGIHILIQKGSLTEFFIEAGFVTMFTLIIALTITMALFRPTGFLGVIVGILLSLIVLYGMGKPLYRVYTANHFHYSYWIALTVICLSGVWSNFKVLAPQALAWTGDNGEAHRFFRRELTPAHTGKGKKLKTRLDRIIIIYLVLWIAVFMTPLHLLFFK